VAKGLYASSTLFSQYNRLIDRVEQFVNFDLGSLR